MDFEYHVGFAVNRKILFKLWNKKIKRAIFGLDRSAGDQIENKPNIS